MDKVQEHEPGGQFYPLKAYKEFMKGKKPDKKHKPGVQHGVKGMFVPHPDPESVPWEITGHESTKILKRRVHEAGEEFQGAADHVYNDLLGRVGRAIGRSSH